MKWQQSWNFCDIYLCVPIYTVPPSFFTIFSIATSTTWSQSLNDKLSYLISYVRTSLNSVLINPKE